MNDRFINSSYKIIQFFAKQKIMLIKSVIFDADGSLVDWKQANASVHEKVTGHKPSFNLRNQILGKDPYDAWTVIRNHYQLEESVESLLARRNALMKEIYKTLPLYPGVQKVYNFFREHKIPYLISSSVSLKDTEEKLSNHRDLLENALMIVCREEGKPKKPDPYLFKRCIELSSFDPETTLVFEDSVPGIKAAVDSGCKSVFIRHFTYHNAEELLQQYNCQPILTVPTLDELDLSIFKFE